MKPLARFARLRCRGLRRRTEGVAAVEFAIVATVLLLIIGGVIDFGHYWYVGQVITNASQNGARYAARYNQDSTATRIPPSSNDVKTYTGNLLDANLHATVTTSGAGFTSGSHGDPLTVKVQAPITWFMVGGFLPSGTLPSSLSASSTLPLE